MLPKIITFISVFLLFNVCLAQEDIPFLGEVSADNANIRADSTVSSSIICVVNKNEQLEVIHSAYDWYKVRLPNSAPAYVKKDLLECVEYSGQAQNAGRSAKVLRERVNVRLEASQGSAIIGKVEKDDIVYILAENGDWYKVKPPLNCFGWINKKFIGKTVSLKEIRLQKEFIPYAVKEIEGLSRGPSCRRLAEADGAKDKDTVIIEGRILPKTIKRVATHKIVDKDKRLYLLKSDELNLNSFNNQRVKIIGRLINSDKARSDSLVRVEKMEAVN